MEKSTRKRRNRRRRMVRCWLRVGGLALGLAVLPILLLVIPKNVSKQETALKTAKIGRMFSRIPSLLGAEREKKETGEGTGEEVSDAPWYLTLVNRENPIPENYQVDLVEVEGGEQVDRRIYEPLTEMLEAAREGNLGQLPLVVSGYRTRETQQQFYDERVAKYRGEGYSQREAEELAGQWVARPGHSEHQLGFAVDLNGATYDMYLWLQENSYKYGFIFRYPGNKTEITGTAEEVWHYRYVGPQAAAEIYRRGICLEEYLKD